MPLNSSPSHLIRRYEDARLKTGGFVAVGNFDGVHLGHQRMVRRLCERANAANVPALVLTFEPSPASLLRPDRVPPLLTTLEDKAELLAEQGAELVFAVPTDVSLLQLSPEEFFETILLQRVNARGVVEGPNFRFGRGREGDVVRLRELCTAADRTLDIVEAVELDGQTVSSSLVRKSISKGDVELARRLLGRPYHVRGTVTTGERRGRTLGFPTANLVDVPTLLPPDGVYAGFAWTGPLVAAAGTVEKFPAAIHLGPNPTFGESARKLEIHLLGYAGDLYGQRLTISFLKRLRGTERFSGLDSLRMQLARDVEEVARVCSG